MMKQEGKWVTLDNGVHVFIKKGQTLDDAIAKLTKFTKENPNLDPKKLNKESKEVQSATQKAIDRVEASMRKESDKGSYKDHRIELDNYGNYKVYRDEDEMARFGSKEDAKKYIDENTNVSEMNDYKNLSAKEYGDKYSTKEYKLSNSDKDIVDDAIYWAGKNGQASVRTVFEQIDKDFKGFRGDAYKDQAITDYIKEKLGDPMDAEEKELKAKYGDNNVKRSSLGGGFVVNENKSNQSKNEIFEDGKKKWVKTKQDEKIWNNLNDDEKYLLSMSNDMGFWYDEVLDNEDVYNKYKDLESEFSIGQKRK